LGEPGKRRGWRKLAARLALLVATSLLALGAVELGFRLFVPVIDVPTYVWDPTVGPRRGPEQTGRMIFGNFIDTRYHFNAQGWNDPRDYVIAKPAGTRRVAVLGDSFVEAVQVNLGESFVAVAERATNRPDRPAEWYNFGNSGWGTAQEYEVLRHYALDYHPDVVILLFDQNDLADCSPYLNPIESQFATYCLDEHDELSLLPPAYWEPVWWKRLALRSALLRWALVQKMLLFWARGSMTTDLKVRAPTTGSYQLPALPRREGAAGGVPAHVVAGVDELSPKERSEKTWLLIEKLLQASNDECKRRGAVFAVAFKGSLLGIESAVDGGTYTPPPKETDPYCLSWRIDEMGKEFLDPLCARHGIPYLDLTEPLRKLVLETRKTHCFAPYDLHYNARSHAVVGAEIARWTETLFPKR
jgi:hypothetical protein